MAKVRLSIGWAIPRTGRSCQGCSESGTAPGTLNTFKMHRNVHLSGVSGRSPATAARVMSAALQVLTDAAGGLPRSSADDFGELVGSGKRGGTRFGLFLGALLRIVRAVPAR